MAQARSSIAWSKTSDDRKTKNPLLTAGVVNIDTLNRILERAETITEGRIDSTQGGKRLFGSSVISCQIRMDDLESLTADMSRSDVVNALRIDQRVARLIDDRVFRELAKLLGEQTSIEFEAQTEVDFVENTLSWSIDFESAIDGRAATAG